MSSEAVAVSIGHPGWPMIYTPTEVHVAIQGKNFNV